MSKVSGSFRAKNENVPTLSSLPSTAKRGYLWKLSGRSILHKSQWKRKLFVLWKSRLYFYQGEGGGGDERGAGTINLKYFSSCVEAPLTDHKKATNVFILLAMEKGFLDQGRCYLSAETLGEMRDWVSALKSALDKLHRNRFSVPDIPEEKLCKSSSLSSLPSQKSDKSEIVRETNTKDRLNKSLDERPAVCDVSLDRTYAYSSSEESLNQSFSAPVPLRNTGSVYSAMTRRSINFGGRRPSGQMLSLSKQNDDILSPTLQRYKDDQFNSLPKRQEPKLTNVPRNNDLFHSLPKRKEDLNEQINGQNKHHESNRHITQDNRYSGQENRPIVPTGSICIAEDESDEDQYHSLPVRRGDEIRTNGHELEKSTSFSSFRESPCHSVKGSRRHLKFQDSESNPSRQGSRLCSREGSSSNISMSTITASHQDVELEKATSGYNNKNNNSTNNNNNNNMSAGSSDMEKKMMLLTGQVDELRRLYRHLDSETNSTRRDVGSVHESLATMNSTARGIEEKIMRFQANMSGIERMSSSLMMEIRSTHDRVLRTLEDADRAKREYLNLKQKAEMLILQIQGDAVALNLPSQQLTQPTLFTFGAQDSGYQTFPKLKAGNGTNSAQPALPSPISKGRATREGKVHFCQDPTHSNDSLYEKPSGPLYSTPNKAYKDNNFL